MAVNVNKEGFQRRLDVVQKILAKYGLRSTTITPLAYVDFCPFPFNNFIYKVDLVDPALPANFASHQQPLTLPPPADTGVSTLVLRLSNARAEGLNNNNRVQNDVAAQHLLRQSLESRGCSSHLVPAVYAWAECTYQKGDPQGEDTFGWSMCEFKTGEDFDGPVETLSIDDARSVLGEQLAPIVAALQGAAIPKSVTKFGSLALNDQGSSQELVSSEMILLEQNAGPFDTYAQVWKSKLEQALDAATKSELLQGWRPGGLRTRIEAFLSEEALVKFLKDVDIYQKVLIHGDLTTNNMLYDPTTKKITAIIDYDWANVSHPCEEFLSGLSDIGGGIHDRMGALQPLALSGDFGTEPPKEDTTTSETETEAYRRWAVAKLWDEALGRAGGIRPSAIPGIHDVIALQQLEKLLAPFDLVTEGMKGRFTDEQRATMRTETEEKIVQWLDLHEK